MFRIPPKAIIYPEKVVPAINAKRKKPLRLDIYHQQFYKLLKEKGVNVVDGKLTYEAVADACGLDFTPLEQVLPLEPVV